MKTVVEVSLVGPLNSDKFNFAMGNIRGVSRTYVEFTSPDYSDPLYNLHLNVHYD